VFISGAAEPHKLTCTVTIQLASSNSLYRLLTLAGEQIHMLQ